MEEFQDKTLSNAPRALQAHAQKMRREAVTV